MNPTVFHLLVALRERPLQAGDLLDELGQMGDAPSLPALYRLLHRCLDDDWIEVVGSDADGPGRPRQIYALTQAGRGAVEREAHRLQALAARALGSEA